jgi:hypothetical protein
MRNPSITGYESEKSTDFETPVKHGMEKINA